MLRLRLFLFLSATIQTMAALTNSPSPTISKVAVIGGTGGLGRQTVQTLSERGIPSKLLFRQRFDESTSVPASLDKSTPKDQVAKYLASLPNVEVVYGDVSSTEILEELLQGCSSCLSLHGATRRSKISDLWSDPSDSDPTHGKQVNYVGILNLIEAARRTESCKRIVRITGKGETPSSFFSVLINLLGSMAKAWNYEGELALRAQTHVDYTIVRPGIMADDGPTGKVLNLSDDGSDLPVARIRYRDVASLCCDCLGYPNAARSTLTSMTTGEDEGSDSYLPLLERVKPDRRSFPTDMLEQHKQAVRKAVALLFGASFALLGILTRLIMR